MTTGRPGNRAKTGARTPWNPLAQRHALAEAMTEQPRQRVLLAEDSDDMRQMIADDLRRAGLDVVEVDSGSALLDYLGAMLLGQRPPVDLIISDVRMPGRSGLSILAGLRRDDWATPVILITAFGDQALHDEARRLGAVALLDKPFTMERLRQLVEQTTLA